MMTLILQAAGFNPSRDVEQPDAANMASTYVSIPLFSAEPKRNAGFSMLLSYTPIGRAQ
jgi:hypothetical protein